MIYILIAKYKSVTSVTSIHLLVFFYLDPIVPETEKYAQPQSTRSPSNNNTFTDQNKEISRDSRILSELL